MRENQYKIEGWLVANGWLRSEKFEEISKMYQVAAEKSGINLRLCYTDEWVYGMTSNGFVSALKEERPNFVLFLDKDVRLAKQFELQGIKVFNSSEVIAICDDKALTFLALQDKGIPMPKTIIAPLIFPGTNDGRELLWIEQLEKELDYPMVIKECFGSFGQQVYQVENREALCKKREELKATPHIYQEMITSSYGQDVRIHVIGEKVVAMMKRTSETDFRANISSGGRMEMIECSPAFQHLAIEVCKVLGADFAGVDLLFGPEDNPILCEVNSNAHIKNILECTGINVAEHIMDYVAKWYVKKG